MPSSFLAASITGEMSWWELLWWTGASSYPHQWWHGTGWAFSTLFGIVFVLCAGWYLLRRLTVSLRA